MSYKGRQLLKADFPYKGRFLNFSLGTFGFLKVRIFYALLTLRSHIKENSNYIHYIHYKRVIAADLMEEGKRLHTLHTLHTFMKRQGFY